MHQWYLKAILGLQESEFAICTKHTCSLTGLQKNLALSEGKHIFWMHGKRSVLNLITKSAHCSSGGSINTYVVPGSFARKGLLSMVEQLDHALHHLFVLRD